MQIGQYPLSLIITHHFICIVYNFNWIFSYIIALSTFIIKIAYINIILTLLFLHNVNITALSPILIIALSITLFIANYIYFNSTKGYISIHLIFIASYIYLHSVGIFSIIITYEYLGIISAYLVYIMGNISINVFIYGRASDAHILYSMASLSL